MEVLVGRAQPTTGTNGRLALDKLDVPTVEPRRGLVSPIAFDRARNSLGRDDRHVLAALSEESSSPDGLRKAEPFVNNCFHR